MVYFHKILIPTDLSEFSLAAVEYAASLGLIYTSKLYMLHVVADAPALLSLHTAEVNPETYNLRVASDSKKELETFVAKNVGRDIKVIPVVRLGNPADEIKRFAEEEGIDLIVLATHGRTGVKHMLMGSIAEKVVRLSNIPVLTVKPQPMRDNILKDEDIETELHLR